MKDVTIPNPNFIVGESGLNLTLKGRILAFESKEPIRISNINNSPFVEFVCEGKNYAVKIGSKQHLTEILSKIHSPNEFTVRTMGITEALSDKRITVAALTEAHRRSVKESTAVTPKLKFRFHERRFSDGEKINIIRESRSTVENKVLKILNGVGELTT